MEVGVFLESALLTGPGNCRLFIFVLQQIAYFLNTVLCARVSDDSLPHFQEFAQVVFHVGCQASADTYGLIQGQVIRIPVGDSDNASEGHHPPC